MSYNKWIGGFLGFINTQSVLGAMAGFVLGALFDTIASQKESRKVNKTQSEQISENSTEEGTRNGFLFSLMVLSSHIIQADGKIMHSEMEFVRGFLRDSFGDKAVEQGNNILLKLFEYRKRQGEVLWKEQIRKACSEIAKALPEEHRIQLVAFLAQIAKADGTIDKNEIAALKAITLYLLLDSSLVEQFLYLGADSLEDAYKVLGVSPNISDDDLKKVYRKLVIKHHPDRVSNLGEDIKEAATKKLQDINKAKDIVYKARKLS